MVLFVGRISRLKTQLLLSIIRTAGHARYAMVDDNAQGCVSTLSRYLFKTIFNKEEDPNHHLFENENSMQLQPPHSGTADFQSVLKLPKRLKPIELLRPIYVYFLILQYKQLQPFLSLKNKSNRIT